MLLPRTARACCQALSRTCLGVGPRHLALYMCTEDDGVAAPELAVSAAYQSAMTIAWGSKLQSHGVYRLKLQYYSAMIQSHTIPGEFLASFKLQSSP